MSFYHAVVMNFYPATFSSLWLGQKWQLQEFSKQQLSLIFLVSLSHQQVVVHYCQWRVTQFCWRWHESVPNGDDGCVFLLQQSKSMSHTPYFILSNKYHNKQVKMKGLLKSFFLRVVDLGKIPSRLLENQCMYFLLVLTRLFCCPFIQK